MSNQQDIYAVGSEIRPPMLNKENCVPYVPLVAASSHEQRDYKLTEKEAKQVKVDDQAIQTILMGIPEEIYAAVDNWESIESYYHRFLKLMNDFSRENHFLEKIAINIKLLTNLQPEWNRSVIIVHQTKNLYEVDYTQLYDFLKLNQADVNEIRAERYAKTYDPLALMAHSHNPYNNPVFHQDYSSQFTNMQHSPPNNNFIPQPSFNQNYMQQPMPNLEDILNPTTAMNMTLVLIAKAIKLNYSTPTNNNQRISSNPQNRQIAQPSTKMVQDRQMHVVGGNGRNQNQNGLIVVPRIANPNANHNGNGIVVAAWAEGMQLQSEEFDLMATAGDIDEIKEVNANCILMTNLQQASILGIQISQAPIYDLDGSSEESSALEMIINLDGINLLKRSHRTNLYTINLHEVASASPICLITRATPTKSWALCYPKNDREDLGKLGAKGDIGFFIGYAANSRAYRIYNQRTKKIMETMNVTFDETSMESATTTNTASTKKNSSSQAINIPNTSQNVNELKTQQQHAQQRDNQASLQLETVGDNVLNAMLDGNTFVNPFATPSTCAVESSSSQYVDPSNMYTFYQPYPHEYQWTKDHPLQ
nr:integrase, catalytic region, zinc finger, CCHC-type, peptidase aspartic, catalytic [Tanacetum cinerariifolium]